MIQKPNLIIVKYGCRDAALLDAFIYTDVRFECTWDATPDGFTHFKPTKTFQYVYFSSCHLPKVKKGFIKRESLRLLRTNSSEKIFEERIVNFKPFSIHTTLSELNFEDRQLSLQPKQRRNQRILPFVRQYQSSAPRTNPHEKLTANRTTIIAERNLQEFTHHNVQKRAVAQTMKKAKTQAWESCGPFKSILRWFSLHRLMVFHGDNTAVVSFQAEAVYLTWQSLNLTVWPMSGKPIRKHVSLLK